MTEAEFQELMRAQRVADQILGKYRNVRPRVVCADGWHASIQASNFHYCSPREDDAEAYSHWEIGFPKTLDPELASYAEDPANTLDDSTDYGVFPHTPVGVVVTLINKHGGFAGWSEE